MSATRREFLGVGAALGLNALLPAAGLAQYSFAPSPGPWRQFRVVTRLDVAKLSGETQAWLPLACEQLPEWFRVTGEDWSTNGDATVHRDRDAPGILRVEWSANSEAPFVELVSRVETRDRAVNLSVGPAAIPLSSQERQRYLASTDLKPTDGIVKTTADKIVEGARDDVAKARAIYEWIVDNCYRRASTRGCGDGDVAALLRSGDFGGKCADLNGLFVALARASGLPARDIYGVRIAPSRFGYKSLGANASVVTKAQHCRAEVYLEAFGWTPMDPADVRKVVLEEPPGNLSLADAKVAAARAALFGAWETNWLPYNFSQDVSLPGSSGPKIGFLMYPQAETAGRRIDSLDAETFRYTIKSEETTKA